MPEIKRYIVDVYGDDDLIREVGASTYEELAAIMPQRVMELRPEMFTDGDLVFRARVCCHVPLVGKPLDVVVADLLAGCNVSLFCI